MVRETRTRHYTWFDIADLILKDIGLEGELDDFEVETPGIEIISGDYGKIHLSITYYDEEVNANSAQTESRSQEDKPKEDPWVQSPQG